MVPWIDQLAEALGEDPLGRGETNALLGAARDVAHRVERKLTPLSTYLLGVAVGRSLAAGAARADAFEDAMDTLRSSLPPEPDPDGPHGAG